MRAVQVPLRKFVHRSQLEEGLVCMEFSSADDVGAGSNYEPEFTADPFDDIYCIRITRA